MPLEEFRSVTGKDVGLHLAEQLSATFGSSFESTVFRMATSFRGLAAAGLLRYRLKTGEQRARLVSKNQGVLFELPSPKPTESVSPRYRRQSFYNSEACGNEHLVPWNKSFDPLSCAYVSGRCTAVQRAFEGCQTKPAWWVSSKRFELRISGKMPILYMATCCFCGGYRSSSE
jgi:hypothetical protein